MAEPRPHVFVIAGPNGAGKSTLAPGILPSVLGVQEFVNADVIARGLSAYQPESVALEAGRIMLRRLHDLAAQRVSFAFETTMASRGFAPWLEELQKVGYEIHLIFLWLPSADIAVNRVKERVSGGGHDVPENIIRRRFQAGLRNFFSLYRPLADSWRFYDNSNPIGPILIAFANPTADEIIVDERLWQVIMESCQ